MPYGGYSDGVVDNFCVHQIMKIEIVLIFLLLVLIVVLLYVQKSQPKVVYIDDLWRGPRWWYGGTSYGTGWRRGHETHRWGGGGHGMAGGGHGGFHVGGGGSHH